MACSDVMLCKGALLSSAAKSSSMQLTIQAQQPSGASVMQDTSKQPSLAFLPAYGAHSSYIQQ